MIIRKLGLIGAMVEEVELLLDHANKETTMTLAGIAFTEGRLDQQPVVICRSGVGKVNAAVCTQLLIDKFGVDAVVFTGVAGALDPRLEIGDLVVSSDCMQHDVDVRALGFALGVIPYQETSVFVADPDLRRLAEEAGAELYGNRCFTGRILSGDQFIAKRETVAALREELDGSCTEMEGAAVAQVCVMNRVPFVVIRSMSDKADGSAHVNFPEFAKQSADRSFAMVKRMVERQHG